MAWPAGGIVEVPTRGRGREATSPSSTPTTGTWTVKPVGQFIRTPSGARLAAMGTRSGEPPPGPLHAGELAQAGHRRVVQRAAAQRGAERDRAGDHLDEAGVAGEHQPRRLADAQAEGDEEDERRGAHAGRGGVHGGAAPVGPRGSGRPGGRASGPSPQPPSSRWRTRPAAAETRSSCVTTSTVTPSCCMPVKSWITASPLRASRLPVGSSASEHGGAGEQGARDGDPLALPAGEPAGKPRPPCRRGRPGRAPRWRAPAARQRKRRHARRREEAGEEHVLHRGKRGEEVEGLEDEADRLVSEGGTLPGAEGAQVPAGHLRLAARSRRRGRRRRRAAWTCPTRTLRPRR